MTANELADYIELHKYNSNYGRIEEAISMLRQQQVEIAILKTQLSYLESKVYGGTTK